MSRLLIVLLGLAAVALALQPSRFGVLTSSRAMFDSFALRYGKTYASEAERTKRFEIFVANVAYINAFNAAANATYTLGTARARLVSPNALLAVTCAPSM